MFNPLIKRTIMKAKYISPQTIVVKICQNQSLLNAVSVGSEYDGGTVLSRRQGSVWDDDEEEEY